MHSSILDPKGKSNKTHLEKLISLIPIPYYLGWFFFSFVFILVSSLISLLFEKAFRYVDAFLIISVIIALEGTIISWAHNKIKSFEGILISIVDLPKGIIIDTCRKQEADIFNDKGILIFALFFILFVHITGIDYHDVSFDSIFSICIFKLGYYLAVYLEGAGLYILIMTALTVHKIGVMPLRIDALYSDFHAIGVLYSKFIICAASVYVIWGFFHIIVPPQFSSLQMILWFLSFAFLLFAYFILPQYSIHRMMTSTKKEKIELFSSQLRAAMDESFEVPTDENVSHLKDIFLVQDKLNQMSEWPFGTYEILYITIIIIIPLIIVLLEIALGIIK
ncbi:MAG: hypothetical protein LUO89_14090 [Methanothrix sp.]|nr:hypothetical protein [Methanothrix sp.]